MDKLENKEIIDGLGRKHYEPPTLGEVMEKINEIVEEINNIKHNIEKKRTYVK